MVDEKDKYSGVTVFMPTDEEKERLGKAAGKAIEAILSFTDKDYETSFVLKNLVESFQEAYNCVIPISPNTASLLIKLKSKNPMK